MAENKIFEIKDVNGNDVRITPINTPENGVLPVIMASNIATKIETKTGKREIAGEEYDVTTAYITTLNDHIIEIASSVKKIDNYKIYENIDNYYYASSENDKLSLPNNSKDDLSDEWKTSVDDVNFNSETPYLWNFESIKTITGDTVEYTYTSPRLLSIYTSNPVFCDLSNEMDSIACTYNGKPLEDAFVDTEVSLYTGETKVLGDYEISLNGNLIDGTSGEISTGIKWTREKNKLSFSLSQESLITNPIKIKAVKDGFSGNTTFTVNKVIPGNPGENAIIYQLNPSINALQYDPNTKKYLGENSILCNVLKINGKLVTELTELPTGYYIKKFVVIDSKTANKNTYDVEYNTPDTFDDKIESIRYDLYNNLNQKIDSETILCVSGGKSNIKCDIDNEMDSVPCDVNGNPIEGQNTVYTNVSLFDGINSIENIKITINNVEVNENIVETDAYNCQRNGNKLTFTLKSAASDKTNINITVEDASDSSKIGSAIFTINKIKAAKEGVSPTIYKLSPSCSTIKWDTKTSQYVSQENIKCVIKSVNEGNEEIYTGLDYILYYKINGGELKPYQTYGVSLNNEKINTIEFVIYKATDSTHSDIIDIETIPVIADGASLKNILELYTTTKSGTDIPTITVDTTEKWGSITIPTGVATEISGVTFDGNSPFMWNKEIMYNSEGEYMSESSWAIIGRYGVDGASKGVDFYYHAPKTTANSTQFNTSDTPKTDVNTINKLEELGWHKTYSGTTHTENNKTVAADVWMCTAAENVDKDGKGTGEYTFGNPMKIVGEDGKGAAEYIDYSFAVSTTFDNTDPSASPIVDKNQGTNGWFDKPQTPTNEKPYLWMKMVKKILKAECTGKNKSDYEENGEASYMRMSNVSMETMYSSTGIGNPNTSPDNWHEIFNTSEDKYMSVSTDGKVSWSNPTKIVGENGKETEYDFGRSSSGANTTSAPTLDTTVGTNGWNDGPIETTIEFPYLWMRITKKNNDGSVKSVSYTRVTGAKGNKGDTGTSINSSISYYGINNNTNTAPTSWSTSVIPTTKDNKYLWSYMVFKGDDNSTISTTEARIISTYVSSPYYIDLDNNNDSIPCKHDGTPISGQNSVSTNVTLYEGNKALENNYTITVAGKQINKSSSENIATDVICSRNDGNKLTFIFNENVTSHPEKLSLQISASTSEISASTVMTISKIKGAKEPIRIVLTNEYDAVQSKSDGSLLKTTNLFTDVIIYEGDERLHNTDSDSTILGTDDIKISSIIANLNNGETKEISNVIVTVLTTYLKLGFYRIKTTLDKDFDKTVDSINITITYKNEYSKVFTISKAKAGLGGVVKLELTNEIDSVPCDAEGNSLIENINLYTDVKLYVGSNQLDTISKLEYGIDNGSTITYKEITNNSDFYHDTTNNIYIKKSENNKTVYFNIDKETSDKLNVSIKATGYNSNNVNDIYSETAIYTLNKLKSGENAKMYRLIPSASSISCDVTTNSYVYNESQIDCEVQVLTGSSVDTINNYNLTNYGLKLTTQIDYQTGLQEHETSKVSSVNDKLSKAKSIIYTLSATDDNTVLDKETVPVLLTKEGKNAIIYKLNTSSSVIPVKDDNSIDNAFKLTCGIRKYDGDTITTYGHLGNIPENLKLYINSHQITEENKLKLGETYVDYISNKTTLNDINLLEAAKTDGELKFELKDVKDNILDLQTVIIVKDGLMPIHADISNEMDAVACEANGNSKSSTLTTTVSLYRGDDIYNDPTVKVEDITINTSDTTLTKYNNIKVKKSNNNGIVTLTITIPKDVSLNTPKNIPFTLSSDGKTGIVTFTITGVIPGSDGKTPIIYQLSPSVSNIKVDKNGNLSNDSITINVTKNNGSSISNITSSDASSNELSVKYKIGSKLSGYTDGTSLTVGNTINGISKNDNYVHVALYNNTTLLDTETISIIVDGNDPIIYQLNPSATAISYNSNSTNNNKFTVTSVSCGITENGTSVSLPTGYKLQYSYITSNGELTASEYTNAIDTNNANIFNNGDLNAIKFILKDNNDSIIDNENVPVVKSASTLGSIKTFYYASNSTSPSLPSLNNLASTTSSNVTISGASTTSNGFSKSNPYLYSVQIMYGEGGQYMSNTGWQLISHYGVDGAAKGVDFYYHSATSNGNAPTSPTSKTVLNGWHTDYNASQHNDENGITGPDVWMCTASSDGTFGTPMKIKGEDGKGAEEYVIYNFNLSKDETTTSVNTAPGNLISENWTDAPLLPTNEYPYLWMQMVTKKLKTNSKSEYEVTETTYVRLSGTAGHNAITTTLDNDTTAIPCNADGELTQTLNPLVTQCFLYDGNTRINTNEVEYTFEYDNQQYSVNTSYTDAETGNEITINQYGQLYVTLKEVTNLPDVIDIKITAKKKDTAKTSTSVFTIIKVKGGKDKTELICSNNYEGIACESDGTPVNNSGIVGATLLFKKGNEFIDLDYLNFTVYKINNPNYTTIGKIEKTDGGVYIDSSAYGVKFVKNSTYKGYTVQIPVTLCGEDRTEFKFEVTYENEKYSEILKVDKVKNGANTIIWSIKTNNYIGYDIEKNEYTITKLPIKVFEKHPTLSKLYSGFDSSKKYVIMFGTGKDDDYTDGEVDKNKLYSVDKTIDGILESDKYINISIDGLTKLSDEEQTYTSLEKLLKPNEQFTIYLFEDSDATVPSDMQTIEYITTAENPRIYSLKPSANKIVYDEFTDTYSQNSVSCSIIEKYKSDVVSLDVTYEGIYAGDYEPNHSEQIDYTKYFINSYTSLKCDPQPYRTSDSISVNDCSYVTFELKYKNDNNTYTLLDREVIDIIKNGTSPISASIDNKTTIIPAFCDGIIKDNTTTVVKNITVTRGKTEIKGYSIKIGDNVLFSGNESNTENIQITSGISVKLTKSPIDSNESTLTFTITKNWESIEPQIIKIEVSKNSTSDIIECVFEKNIEIRTIESAINQYCTISKTSDIKTVSESDWQDTVNMAYIESNKNNTDVWLRTVNKYDKVDSKNSIYSYSNPVKDEYTSRMGSKTTYIGNDGIYSGKISADNITAGTINASDIHISRIEAADGTIGSFNINSTDLSYIDKDNIGISINKYGINTYFGNTTYIYKSSWPRNIKWYRVFSYNLTDIKGVVCSFEVKSGINYTLKSSLNNNYFNVFYDDATDTNYINNYTFENPIAGINLNETTISKNTNCTAYIVISSSADFTESAPMVKEAWIKLSTNEKFVGVNISYNGNASFSNNAIQFNADGTGKLANGFINWGISDATIGGFKLTNDELSTLEYTDKNNAPDDIKHLNLCIKADELRLGLAAELQDIYSGQGIGTEDDPFIFNSDRYSFYEYNSYVYFSELCPSLMRHLDYDTMIINTSSYIDTEKTGGIRINSYENNQSIKLESIESTYIYTPDITDEIWIKDNATNKTKSLKMNQGYMVFYKGEKTEEINDNKFILYPNKGIESTSNGNIKLNITTDGNIITHNDSMIIKYYCEPHESSDNMHDVFLNVIENDGIWVGKFVNPLPISICENPDQLKFLINKYHRNGNIIKRMIMLDKSGGGKLGEVMSWTNTENNYKLKILGESVDAKTLNFMNRLANNYLIAKILGNKKSISASESIKIKILCKDEFEAINNPNHLYLLCYYLVSTDYNIWVQELIDISNSSTGQLLANGGQLDTNAFEGGKLSETFCITLSEKGLQVDIHGIALTNETYSNWDSIPDDKKVLF